MTYTLYSTFVTFIIILKVIFVLLSIAKIVVKNRKPENTKLVDKLQFWRERIEFIFIICMAILLIYIFYPGSKKLIDQETKFLFYLFGFILLFTAKWGTFFKESPALLKIQSVLSNR